MWRIRRLSTRIYLTIIATLIAVVVGSGAFWRWAADPLPSRQAFEVAGELAAIALAPADADREAQDAAIRDLATRLRLDLALFDEDRRPVAAAGRPLPPPPEHRDDSGWMFGGGGPTWAIVLPDSRWLVASARRPPSRPALRFIAFLGAIAAVVALLAWPLVGGLTRRLERLQQAVETLGEGDLGARVEVQGKDEIARLAESFNRSAARIETLVGAQKMLLANASHELRTPLSRIRMGLELIRDGDQARQTALQTDIAELDDLIDEILLMSRLDTQGLNVREDVDLLALAAEEAVHYEGCDVSGLPINVSGDPRLLRRLIRNLLDNAARHGAPPIKVNVDRDGRHAMLTVADGGPGIAWSDRERVFEPFTRGRESRREQGTGLGLALVRQIARRHGGDATIAPVSSGQPGTRIVVWLPMDDITSPSPREREEGNRRAAAIRPYSSV